MSAQRVEVRIEELVLHGFPPLDRRAVAEAVERSLAEPGALAAPSLAARPYHDAGALNVGAVTPPALGAVVAKALAAAIGRRDDAVTRT